MYYFPLSLAVLQGSPFLPTFDIFLFLKNNSHTNGWGRLSYIFEECLLCLPSPHPVNFFWPLLTSSILVSQSGMDSTPPAAEGGVLTTGPPGKSPKSFLIYLITIKLDLSIILQVLIYPCQIYKGILELSKNFYMTYFCLQAEGLTKYSIEWERMWIYPFFFLARPCGLWDLSSSARDWTWAPSSGKLGVLITGLLGSSQHILFLKFTYFGCAGSCCGSWPLEHTDSVVVAQA